MAVLKKRQNETQTEVARLKSQLEKYESFFGELDTFIEFTRERRDELVEAIAEEAKLKAQYAEAKERRQTLESSISGAKDALFQLVEPGVMEFMPLLDRMEPADPEKHGEHSDQWRTEPIAALNLSPTATRFLIDADIIAVGQLQDRVLASAAEWYMQIEGITAAVAAAIVDKLNDFIYRKEHRGDE